MASGAEKLRRLSGAILLASLALAAACGCRPAEPPAGRAARDPGPEGGVDGDELSDAERAVAAFQAGLEFELAGQIDEATECYRRAARLRPDGAVYHARLGQLLIGAGRGEEGAAARGTSPCISRWPATT